MFRLLLVSAMALPMALPPRPALAFSAPSEADIDRAKALYEEGRKAYRRGEVEVALERFNEAYDLTELPVILYNIGLTYTKIYQTSNDIEHLRRGQVVLENFKIQLAADPSLGEFESLDEELERIAGLIEEAEGASSNDAGAQSNAGETGDGSGEADPDAGAGDDVEGPPAGAQGFLGGAGRTLKLAGIGSLAGGGALAIGGVVGALVMQGNYFDEVALLDLAEQDREDAGCPDAGPSVCDEWDQLLQQRAARANAYRRNIGLLAGTLGGAGAAAIGAGVALIVVGGKKDRKGVARFNVSPTLGGIVVRGRF
jgi:tetratricopeptide (TPR) repeat protein